MSWWIWALVAWFVVSVPSAVLTAKFIALGRERQEPRGDELGPVVDLAGAEAAEAAELRVRLARARPEHPAPGPAGSQPARSG
ncbi:MAG TPA: hypothetical protein VFC99_01240 [Acidimicrobiia bacterium]|nr:hypothetical protein [Acidimicrobiia bacterium]